MKIKPITTVYLITAPFKITKGKGALLYLILSKKVIISGVKSADLTWITLRTTKADSIFTPRMVRVEIDSRYLSLDKVEKIFTQIFKEIQAMFHKDNMQLTNKILKPYL